MHIHLDLNIAVENNQRRPRFTEICYQKTTLWAKQGEHDIKCNDIGAYHIENLAGYGWEVTK